ncbi:hypothetical protein KAR91_46145 [Candidatus Pacearchaeota archaeon]|nr:hypothetical protein [Candidatus Pacearchaeota archaeon]
MPYRKCDECHHEWEGDRKSCDWCPCKTSTLLEQTTPLERLCKRLFGGRKDVRDHSLPRRTSDS